MTLSVLLVMALALRCAVVFGHVNFIHPDEMFQYLEQGHRLAFGSGVVPWEYDYGIRSWFLPSLLAAIMKVSGWVNSNPLLYIYVSRFLASAMSLAVVGFGFLMVLRRAGVVWATVTGFFCAIWFHAVFLSPSILTEVFSAYLMFPAVYLASEQASQTARTPLVLGLLLGIAFCLRFQMAPALFVIACWYCRLDFKGRWLPVTLAASAVVAVISGFLDYLTLGKPFQSIWLNYYVNAIEGVSGRFGRGGPFQYLDFLTTSGAIAAIPLGWLALIGCYQARLLALTCLTVLISHSLFPHKEYRFIAFVLLSAPILIGLGGAALSRMLFSRVGVMPSISCAVLVTFSVPIASWYGWNAGAPVEYQPNTGVLDSFVAAHDQPGLCGLGVANYLWTTTGGYTYLNRDVPVYYQETTLSALSRVRSQMRVVVRGKPVAQYSGYSLFRHTPAFNYLVARSELAVTGYKTVRCFANETAALPSACLLHRPGGCSDH